jgi:hypothetical protein
MEQWEKDIAQHNLQKAINCELGFNLSIEDFLKSRSGVYLSNAKNRKLGRIGQKYGSKKTENEVVFHPEGNYEALDKNGYPKIAYTDQETGMIEFITSNVKELAASKIKGGAVAGLFSMLRSNNVNAKNITIDLYEIKDKPTIEIPIDAPIDFKYIHEVRYRKDVKGKKVQTIKLNNKQLELLNDLYDLEGWKEDLDIDALLSKYKVHDVEELQSLWQKEIANLVGGNEKDIYYRAVVNSK